MLEASRASSQSEDDLTIKYMTMQLDKNEAMIEELRKQLEGKTQEVAAAMGQIKIVRDVLQKERIEFASMSLLERDRIADAQRQAEEAQTQLAQANAQLAACQRRSNEGERSPVSADKLKALQAEVDEKDKQLTELKAAIVRIQTANAAIIKREYMPDSGRCDFCDL